jgi:RND superfamily putative drug exporter
VPITLIILIVVFGALVAAGIPLLLALTAVLATFGLWAIPSQIWPSDESLYAMILLIGLAVGVDYSMFYLKREREERAAGRSPEQALEIAAATSGRSVLVSGATVIIAMAGLLFAGEGFAPFGVATMLVVAVAMIGSLTFLPAVLSKLGDNVERLRVPLVHRRRRETDERRIGLGRDRRPCPAPAGALRSTLRRAAAAHRRPLFTPYGRAGIDTYPQALGVMKRTTVSSGVPGHRDPGQRRRQGGGRQFDRNQECDRRTRAAGGRDRADAAADHRRRQRAGTVANVAVPIAGKGTTDRPMPHAAALRDDRPRDDRRRSRHRGRGRWVRCRVEGLQ